MTPVHLAEGLSHPAHIGDGLIGVRTPHVGAFWPLEVPDVGPVDVESGSLGALSEGCSWPSNQPTACHSSQQQRMTVSSHHQDPPNSSGSNAQRARLGRFELPFKDI